MRKFILILIICFFNHFPAQKKISVWERGQMPNSKGLKLEIEEEKEGRITQIQEA